jgi:hypothetical protein
LLLGPTPARVESTMAKKPFSEVDPPKSAARSAAPESGPGSGGIEDKVKYDSGIFKPLIDRLNDKILNPKEKDDAADKYYGDKAIKDNNDKSQKDQKDFKNEKFEKEHKDVIKDTIKESDTGEFGTVAVGALDKNHLLKRLEALEAEIGQLKHFITRDQRPDLGKAALKDEPDAS